MTKSKLNPLLDVLDVLERERDAILLGEFIVIEQIFQEKEHLVSQIDFAAAPRDFSTKVLYVIERNQSIIEAAIQGLKSAASQLNAEKKGRNVSSFYTAHGSRAAICPSGINNLKRF